MLKQRIDRLAAERDNAATFGWLCVETYQGRILVAFKSKAATFGWLCVETTTNKEIASNTARQLPLGSYLLKPDLIKLNSIIFTFLLYLSTQFIPNNISPLYFPLIRSRLCPIFSFHDLQLCVFLTFILTYLMS